MATSTHHAALAPSSPESTVKRLLTQQPHLIDFWIYQAVEGLRVVALEEPQARWASPAFWQHLGHLMPKDDASWPPLSALMPGEDVRKEGELLKNLTKTTGETLPERRLSYWHQAGHLVSFRVSYLVVEDPATQQSYLWIGHCDRQQTQKNKRDQSLTNSRDIYVNHVDLKGNYTYLNQAYAERFGYDIEAAVGTSALAHILPVDHEACYRAVETCLKNPGEPVSVTLRKPTGEGKGRLITQWEFMGTVDEQGQPNGVQAIGYDITAEAQATRNYEQLVNHLEDLVVKVDAQGLITFVSPSFCRAIGWEAHAMRQKHIATLFHQEQADSLRELITQIAEQEAEAKRFTGYIKSWQDHWYHVEWTLSPIPFSDEILFIGRDLNHRKALQEAISFRAKLLDSVGQAVIATDPKGTVLYWNQAAVQLYGYQAKEAIGRPIYELTPSDQSMEEAKAIMAQLVAGKSWGGEFMVKDKWGQEFLAQVNNRPVMDHQGSLTAIIGVSTDITDQRAAESALRKSEVKYRFLFNHINDLICLHDLEGTYLEVSPASMKLLGYQPEEMVGEDPYDFFHPEDRNWVRRQSHDAVRRGQKNARIQYRMRHKEGHYLWFDTITEPFFDMDGHLIRLMTTSRDISDLRALHDRLTRLSNLMEAMLSNTDDFIFFKDKDHRLVAVSQSVADLFQAGDRDALVGKTDDDLLPPDQVSPLRAMEEEVYRTGKMVSLMQELTTPTGDTGYVENRKYPIFDAEGEIIGLYGVARDVTSLKAVERELKNKTELLLKAQRLASMGSYQTDLQAGTWVGSENFIRLFGLPEQDFYTIEQFEALVHPEDRERTIAYFHQCLAEQKDFDYEYRVIHQQTGKVMHIVSRSRVEYAEDGTPLWLYGVKQDVTEQKEAEEAQRRAEQMEVKNREMEQFAYVASHDLQEPLRTIKSYVSLLQEDHYGQLGEEADLHINTITKAVDRMTRLIRELLTYSRLGQDRERTRVDLNVLVTEVLEDLEAKIHETQAQIQVQPLPTLEVFDTEFHQLFLNLIGNALKFHRPGEAPNISVTVAQQENKWIFAVHDDGVGIEQKYLDRIFIIFQRLHSARKYEGSGIGLAYCKKIVEMHHGEIWVESTPGVGSTFFFSMPVYEKEK